MLTFMHFVMEHLFLVQKLALVKEIRKFDRDMVEMLQRLNALRNAMAHSFVPEMKRDYRKTRKVTWKGQDIYTTQGIQQFDKHAEPAGLPVPNGIRKEASELRYQAARSAGIVRRRSRHCGGCQSMSFTTLSDDEERELYRLSSLYWKEALRCEEAKAFL